MRIELLGTTGYHPNARRDTACVMLPELGVVLDAGTGMFRVRERLVTSNFDIFLTHAHLDHVIGLTYLFSVLDKRPIERVTVHGLAEKLDAIQDHLLSEHIFPVPLPCRYQPLTGPVALNDGSTLRYFPLDHPGGSLGFRIDWPDKSMAYITDTTAHPNAKYVAEIRNVDLLIHECYFPDGREDRARLTGHSSLTPVAQVAAAANVKRCVLVHIDPLEREVEHAGMAAARKIFANLHTGEDEQVWEI